MNIAALIFLIIESLWFIAAIVLTARDRHVDDSNVSSAVFITILMIVGNVFVGSVLLGAWS